MGRSDGVDSVTFRAGAREVTLGADALRRAANDDATDVAQRAQMMHAVRVKEMMREIVALSREKKSIAAQIKGLREQLAKEAAYAGGTLLVGDDMLICIDGAPVQLGIEPNGTS